MLLISEDLSPRLTKTMRCLGRIEEISIGILSLQHMSSAQGSDLVYPTVPNALCIIYTLAEEIVVEQITN